MDLVKENLIFVGKDTNNLMKHGSFYTKYVSEIESDPVGAFGRCREALSDLGIDDVSDEGIFQHISYIQEKIMYCGNVIFLVNTYYFWFLFLK